MTLKSDEFWALYNCSTLWCVEKTKRQCRECAEQATGEDWTKCKRYFEIKKVKVIEADESPSVSK